jgi:hypothetical protein
MYQLHMVIAAGNNNARSAISNPTVLRWGGLIAIALAGHKGRKGALGVRIASLEERYAVRALRQEDWGWRQGHLALPLLFLRHWNPQAICPLSIGSANGRNGDGICFARSVSPTIMMINQRLPL